MTFAGDGSTHVLDYIIVGGGSAGCVMAARLSEDRDAQVCLLEAGPRGSSSINAMLYIRGQREDYEHWATEGNPGWGWNGLLPYFLKAEHNERGADAHHATGGPLNVMDPLCPSRTAALFIECC